MKALDFSVKADTLEAGYTLLPLLEEFEKRHPIHVNLTVQLFQDARGDLLRL